VTLRGQVRQLKTFWKDHIKIRQPSRPTEARLPKVWYGGQASGGRISGRFVWYDSKKARLPEASDGQGGISLGVCDQRALKDSTE